MSQERLNSLATLCIEKGLLDEIDIDTIITDFASRTVRRHCFIFFLNERAQIVRNSINRKGETSESHGRLFKETKKGKNGSQKTIQGVATRRLLDSDEISQVPSSRNSPRSRLLLDLAEE